MYHTPTSIHLSIHRMQCITNINDVISFDFVTISGCRRHRLKITRNNIRGCVSLYPFLRYMPLSHVWYTNERFFASVYIVCTQKWNETEFRRSIVFAFPYSKDIGNIAQNKCAPFICLVLSHRRQTCGILNWVFRVKKGGPYNEKRTCVCIMHVNVLSNIFGSGMKRKKLNVYRKLFCNTTTDSNTATKTQIACIMYTAFRFVVFPTIFSL